MVDVRTEKIKGFTVLDQRVLRCPVCEKGPIEQNKCTACRNEFPTDDGTPLFTTDLSHLAFPVRYVSLDETREILAAAFGRPETSGAAQDVYHLDLAHVPYIEGLSEGSFVLEVGCGGGQMRRWVENQGLHYIGTDISKTRVHAHLAEFGGPDFISDVHQLPIKSDTIDLVYSAAVTEHLPAPHRAVQEIFRVLKPGGYYLGNCSFIEPWHDESYFHISPNGAASLLAQAGFEVVAIWPSTNYSGYKSLLAMDNTATRLLKPLGGLMAGYSHLVYKAKRFLRGARGYTETSKLLDVAKTAGAVDWVARKPPA